MSRRCVELPSVYPLRLLPVPPAPPEDEVGGGAGLDGLEGSLGHRVAEASQRGMIMEPVGDSHVVVWFPAVHDLVAVFLNPFRKGEEGEVLWPGVGRFFVDGDVNFRAFLFLYVFLFPFLVLGPLLL